MKFLSPLSMDILQKLKKSPQGLTFNELTYLFPYWEPTQIRNLLYRMIAQRIIRTKPITEEHKKKAAKYYLGRQMPSKVYVARQSLTDGTH